MSHRCLVSLAACALVLVTAREASAQGRGGARYDRAAVQTVTGIISVVDTLPSPRGFGGGLHVQLKAADKTYDVHLGPQSFLATKSLTLAVGDHVQVTGSLVQAGGSPALLASTVTRGTLTVALRDSLGMPLWAVARRGRPQPN